MTQLSKYQITVFLVGGLLMVIGAGASLFSCAWAPYVFAPGALCYVSMQMLLRYDGPSFTIRRLRRIMLLSDVLLLVSALLMFASSDNPLGLDYMTYLQYVYRKWVLTLLIAAVLQLYTTHRIGSELEKEAKKL